MRRVLRAVGAFLALAMAGSLLAFVGYASMNLEELKAEVPRMDGTKAPSPMERAADGAIGFAQSVGEPPAAGESDGKGYRFSSRAPGNGSALGHWCSTDVIGYRIDYTAVSQAGRTRLAERIRWREALAAWTQASGGRYRFKYLGEADYPVDPEGEYPIAESIVPKGEIAITYAVPPETKAGGYAGYRHPVMTDSLGLAGVTRVSWSPGPETGLISRGMIVLDAVDAANDPKVLPTPYVHEAGHALGLAHVDDTAQIMTTQAGATARINSGDRAGITRLAAASCH